MDENWGLVGHEWAVRLLQRALRQGDLSHAYLFTGPPGVGKSTLALALARALLCEGDPRPCGACRPCRLVDKGNHPDLRWVEPESKAGRLTIEQVRELQRQLSLTPQMGRYRVAILERFEQATASAANALLKMLEEPPPFVHLVLLAADTDSLLPTIVSRCQVVPLRPLAPEAVRQALQARWGAEPERADLLAHLCGGRLGWAIRALEDPQPLRQRQQRLDDLEKLLQATLVERFRYAQRLSRETEGLLDVLDLWAGWWRDVLLLSSGAEEGLVNVDRRASIEKQAARLGAHRAAALVAATRAAADRLQRNANPLLTLEVLLVFDWPRC